MKKITQIGIVATLCFTLIGCPKEKKDDTTALGLLLLAAQGGSLSPAAAKTTGSVRNSISGSISAATTAAKNGTITFKIDMPKSRSKKDMDRLMADVHTKARLLYLTKERAIKPNSLATANGGMTCNSDFSTCTGTVNGTASCSQGGTVKLVDMVVSMSFFSTPNIGSSGSAKGTIVLNKCKSNSANYFDYPNYVVSEGTGTVTVDTTNKFLYNSFSYGTYTSSTSGGVTTSTFSTLNGNYTVEENSTSNSTDFKDATGTTIALSNFKTVLKVTVDSKGTNVSISSNSDFSNYTFKGDYQDTLDGSLVSTGSVGGQAINATYTYSKSKVYSYNISCTISSSTTDCTLTNK